MEIMVCSKSSFVAQLFVFWLVCYCSLINVLNFIGKAVAKFCAKYLHRQVLKHEAYLSGDIGTSVQKSFFRSFSNLW